MILNLYKNIGETPLNIIEKFKRENPEYEEIKMTYAGRLDPMAEGLLIILCGDEVHNKEKYLGLNKEYEFEILFNVRTDTGDVLGIVETFENKMIDEATLKDVLGDFVGKRTQKYPDYSSKTINGVPMWKKARSGDVAEEIPEHEIEIFDLELISTQKLIGKEIKEIAEEKIKKVEGDFRQTEIINSWQERIDDKEQFFVVKVIANVSSGTYIRVLAEEIGVKLDTKGIAFSIKRTRVGDNELQ